MRGSPTHPSFVALFPAYRKSHVRCWTRALRSANEVWCGWHLEVCLGFKGLVDRAVRAPRADPFRAMHFFLTLVQLLSS